MIWKEHDFAREVCRQLVELASIRKRVSGDADLLARVQRLEASHQGLLKKLDESYRERRAAKAPERIAHRSLPDTAARNALEREGPPKAPRLDEQCARCNRLLLSGVLSGEDIRWKQGRWYHKACLARVKEEAPGRGPLN